MACSFLWVGSVFDEAGRSYCAVVRQSFASPSMWGRPHHIGASRGPSSTGLLEHQSSPDASTPWAQHGCGTRQPSVACDGLSSTSTKLVYPVVPIVSQEGAK